MISITAEYALRATSFLAQDCNRAWTTHEIAQATHVPVSYLSKVLQLMTKAEVIRSVRGIHGGYQLARSANKLSALEVINSVDPIQRIQRCPLGLKKHKDKLCRLHHRVDKAIALVESAFKKTKISEMMPKDDDASQCQFPALR